MYSGAAEAAFFNPCIAGTYATGSGSSNCPYMYISIYQSAAHISKILIAINGTISFSYS
jgi:hypothetical protein